MKKGLLTVAAVLAVVLVAWAGAAFATSMAALKLDPPTGDPGTSVRVTGTWFAAPGDDRYAEVSPVQIRWGGVEGPVVAVVEPDEGGTFIIRLTAPAAAGGAPEVVVGVQTVTYEDGRIGRAPGTPARAAFAMSNAPVEGPNTSGATGGTAPRTAVAWPGGLVAVGLAAAGLAMFTGAGALLVRDLSRHRLEHRLAGVEMRREVGRTPCRPMRESTSVHQKGHLE